MHFLIAICRRQECVSKPKPKTLPQFQVFSLCFAAQVGALHLLGPEYLATFSPLESNPTTEQSPSAMAVLMDAKDALGPKLLLSYNAQVPILFSRTTRVQLQRSIAFNAFDRRSVRIHTDFPDCGCCQCSQSWQLLIFGQGPQSPFLG